MKYELYYKDIDKKELFEIQRNGLEKFSKTILDESNAKANGKIVSRTISVEFEYNDTIYEASLKITTKRDGDSNE